MRKKTSDELDVGSEDFEAVLKFLSEESESQPTDIKADQRDWSEMKLLLAAPAQNRRAIRGYLRQTISPRKGDHIKKAA
ncbi:hypothetical protein [Bdellovibrio sp. HCB337]|uniref:hypothetical protein n=1 Tax=Bdellovibrio sp. HCB337 TaxID=3394358 RepID=UPI0039A6FB48